jgi:hypothetical protein
MIHFLLMIFERLVPISCRSHVCNYYHIGLQTLRFSLGCVTIQSLIQWFLGDSHKTGSRVHAGDMYLF